MRKRFRNLLAKFYAYASFLATRPFHSLCTKVLSAASLKEMRPPLAQGQKDCMVSFFAPFTLLWAATCCQAIGLGTHGRWGHPHLHVPKVGMFFAPTLSASVATNAPPILTNEWLSTRICASPVPKVQRMCAPSTIIFSIYVTFRIQGKPHTFATGALCGLRHISVGVAFGPVAVCLPHSTGLMQLRSHRRHALRRHRKP